MRLAWLASIWVGLVAPDTGDAERLYVEPIDVEGSIPTAWYETADAKLAEGLGRGSLVVERSATPVCARTECLERLRRESGAEYLVRPRLRVDASGRDYEVELEVVSLVTGEAVVTIEGRCELCGIHEAVETLASKAANVQAALERIRAGATTLTLTTRPPGARVELDGEFVGSTPLTVSVTPGVHRVLATREGYLPQGSRLDAVEGMQRDVELRLLPAPASAPDPRSRALIAGGATSIALGVAAIAAGAVLIAIDGDPNRADCQTDGAGNCRFLYSTRTGGIIGLAFGAASVAGGTTLLGLGIRRRARESDTGPRRSRRAGLTR